MPKAPCYHLFCIRFSVRRVASAKAKDEDSVYAQYYDYAEPLNKIPGHRVLALDRGEREGFLKVTIQVDAERAAGIVSWMFARKKTGGKSAELVDAAARDAYSRLIHPSLENELRGELSDAAAEGAIKVFGDNLRQLLLQPPIRGKTVMGLDPGYRMGCKVAVVDPTGKVLIRKHQVNRNNVDSASCCCWQNQSFCVTYKIHSVQSFTSWVSS